jgi:hypothetical protein
MKSCLSVGLFYNCQTVGIGLWFKNKHGFSRATSQSEDWEPANLILEVINEFNQAACFYSLTLFSFQHLFKYSRFG